MTATVVALVLLAGCAPSDQSPPSPPPTETPAGADPEEIVETVTLVTQGAEVEMRVHPLVRQAEHLVLTVDLVATSLPEGVDEVADHRFETVYAFGADEAGQFGDRIGGMLRLVDAGERRVHLGAYDAQREPVGHVGGSLGGYALDADGIRVQRVFAAPEQADAELGLILPGAYLESLPVIDAEPPAPVLEGDQDADPDTDPIDVSQVAEAPIVPLDSVTRQLEGAVTVIESTEQVEVSLAGDVLFATGSADLGPEAAAVLDAAAQTLSARDNGTVEVVGHTDDVDTTAYNQDLSERRAESVAAALGERIDTDAFEIVASGRGETEPLVPNDSEENRQLNRRVTLTLTSVQKTETEIQTEGATQVLSEDKVARGDEGIVVTIAGDSKRIVAPAARRISSVIALTFEVSPENASGDELHPMGVYSGHFGFRGEGTQQGSNVFAPRSRSAARWSTRSTTHSGTIAWATGCGARSPTSRGWRRCCRARPRRSSRCTRTSRERRRSRSRTGASASATTA